jgi:hypothetical protein
MLNLITSFYLSKNVARQKELDETLIHNINCLYISKIHLFLDNNKCFEYLNQLIKDKSKIFIIRIGNQPLYSDLFGYANRLQNKICMISNSDVWLKEIKKKNLINILQHCNNMVYSLTRYEHDYSCPLIDNYEGSHDVFIFKSPIQSGMIRRINHPQNVWGSENVLLYELKKFQYRIFNPCKSIITVHEHKSEERNEGRIRINLGDNYINGQYNVRSAIVPPCEPTWVFFSQHF